MKEDIDALVEEGCKRLERMREGLERDVEKSKEIVKETEKSIRGLVTLASDLPAPMLRADVLALGEVRVQKHGSNESFGTRNIRVVNNNGLIVDLVIVRGPEAIVEPGLYRLVLMIERVES